MKSRYNVISMTAAVVLLFLLLIHSQGYQAAWELMGIPPMTPHFADVRVITHGAEAHAQGLDPLINNPSDPWHRRMNYPRVWQLLYLLGINESHTTLIGLAIIASFWIGISLLLPNATNSTLALVFAAAVSPAALLGMERANIDLFIFLLVVLSILAIQRSNAWAMVALMAGFVLKLFPLFGWVILLKLDASKIRRPVFLLAGLAALYLFATFSDILLIIEGTPRAAFFSYGMNVCWMALAEENAAVGKIIHLLSWFLVALILGLSFSALWRNGPAIKDTDTPMHLDAFRAGAGIYAGTFLIGNNWDYRLIFLILTLPQLLSWAGGSGVHRLISIATLTAILLSCWHMLIIKLFFGYGEGYQWAFLLDELAHWTAFAGVTYLLFSSAPAWIKEYLRHPNPSGASTA